MADPKFVRLADHLARGCQVDINSGWSIAGLDVVEFPTDESPRAQQFVRTALSRGVLDGASQAEFDEVQEASSVNLYEQAGVQVEPHKIQGYYQEAHLSGPADDARRRLESARGLGGGELSLKDDVARRERLIAAQAELDGLEDHESRDVEQPDPVSPVGRQIVGGDPEKSGAREDLDEDVDTDDEAPKKSQRGAKKSASRSR